MSNTLYTVCYTGPFGFIKPWTAVRDGETFSQQFLTPSIVEGIRQKLEVSQIVRHRLSHWGLDLQQERIQSAGWKQNRRSKALQRETSILRRGILLRPVLHLLFISEEDATKAFEQHICLCRNEDILYPKSLSPTTITDFEQVPGFELLFGREQPGSFMVGYNRFEEGQPMYGALQITGDPTEIPS